MPPATTVHERRRKVRQGAHIALLLFLTALLGVVIWLDVNTNVWQEVVILSGIASGLLMFILTAVFFDRWVSRVDHQRWLPVTQLALTDLLHALADNNASQLERGVIKPRSLPQLLELNNSPTESDTAIDSFLNALLQERMDITNTLAKWSSFLAASADVQMLMNHLSGLALQLDAIRDLTIRYETQTHSVDLANEIDRQIREYDATIRSAISEIEEILGKIQTAIDQA